MLSGRWSRRNLAQSVARSSLEESMATNGTAGQRMPVLFAGHGNPMNALEDNPYTSAWKRIGTGLPRPRSIVSVSAHWYNTGSRVSALEGPITIPGYGGGPYPP